jgi:hypothetical protein
MVCIYVKGYISIDDFLERVDNEGLEDEEKKGNCRWFKYRW